MVKNGVDDIVVLWDSSGSMNGRETEIMSEVIGICMDMHMSIRVICCDAMICSDQSGVESPEDIDFAGGGGSNFLPAFDRLHEEGYQGVVVVFTDGYITVPDVKPPHIRDVLWMLFENGNGKDVDPTGGRWGEAISVGPDGFIKSMVRGRDEAAN
jgi:predicted metal-dependent peptidase